MDIKKMELGFVNAYLLKGNDGFILIDTGLPFQWEVLDKQLAEAGCKPGNLKLVVITHSDWDHTGNALKLREKYGAKIAMSRADARSAETGKMPKRTIRSCKARLRLFMIKVIRRFQRRKMVYPSFKTDIILNDGDSLVPYGLNAIVFLHPGHTVGSISVLTKEGDLFCGDTVVNTDRPQSAIYIQSSGELEASLGKIRKLNAKMVYPGHGKPFEMKEFKDE